jgi:hypothetical protein
MHTPLAKIAFIVIICCLITLVVGAETSRPINPSPLSPSNEMPSPTR